MPRRFISRELKEKALELSLRGVSDTIIEEYLGIKKCTLRRIRQKFCQTGEVVQVPACSGRSRLLDGLDVQVRLLSFLVASFVTNVLANVFSLLRGVCNASQT